MLPWVVRISMLVTSPVNIARRNRISLACINTQADNENVGHVQIGFYSVRKRKQFQENGKGTLGGGKDQPEESMAML